MTTNLAITIVSCVAILYGAQLLVRHFLMLRREVAIDPTDEPDPERDAAIREAIRSGRPVYKNRGEPMRYADDDTTVPTKGGGS